MNSSPAQPAPGTRARLSRLLPLRLEAERDRLRHSFRQCSEAWTEGRLRQPVLVLVPSGVGKKDVYKGPPL